jgi:Tetratricopeptide repeat
MAISRGPTPPGPVTELFDRLDQLYLAAGRPSMREIATRAGRGKISSSTVHNVFRGSRVPRWNSLEEIVKALHGNTAEFLALWQSAWQAENRTEAPQVSPSEVPPSARIQSESGGPGPSQRIWSAEIPSRHPDFTGRVAELEALRANLVNRTRPHPPAQVISGMGGVGKTEIATEYIHLYRDKYEIIWWIRAEHHDRVRDALVKLGQRLELRVASTRNGRDRTITAVLDALESGERLNWLLVYDNAADARQLTLETLALLQQRYGDENEVALLCANDRGADLRAHGQFEEALELDRRLLPKFERVLGPDHERTLNVRNNLAEDYRRLGRFQKALETDQSTFQDRLRILGPNDLRTLFSRNAVARDLRGLGQYQDSLDIARQVVGAFAAANRPENWDWLYARTGFATALRKAGHYWDALQESEDVVQRYRDYLGADHTEALRAAANLINDRRAVGDLASAEELGREVLDRCRDAGFPFDIGYAALVGLASVLRADGRPEEARKFDLQAWDGLIETYGDSHPFTLAAGINYASDLAACGELAEAIRIGQATLAKCRRSLHEHHPDTLIAASNLALDQAASGDQDESDRLLADVLRTYEETLTAEHPAARAAAQRIRITAEIDLSPD